MKVNLRYQGREMSHKEIGFEVLKGVVEKLSEIAVTESEAKMEGRQLFVIMAPDSVKIKDYLAHVKKLENSENS